MRRTPHVSNFRVLANSWYTPLYWVFRMDEQRLGDVMDDYCVKCSRLTNHSIVSLVDGQAAKVLCRTCYHDHNYRHEQVPPTKKELKKAEEAAAALAAVSASGDGSKPEENVNARGKVA